VTPEQIVEATLFASQTPLTPAELARADEGLSDAVVEEAIQLLRERYEADEAAFQIYQLGDGYQVLTRPEFAPYLERFDSVPRSPHLSAAALESLAIIAYRQPIGRIQIEDVRGVSASSVLRTLLDWELVTVVGRGEGLGRPLLYGTTDRFLEHFGLKGLSDLPSAEELPVELGAPEDQPDWEPLPEPEAMSEAEPELEAEPEEESELEAEPERDAGFEFVIEQDPASADAGEPPAVGAPSSDSLS
jgi:segregation and condensation protein B